MKKEELEKELSMLRRRKAIKLLLMNKGLSGEEERKQELEEIENQINNLKHELRSS